MRSRVFLKVMDLGYPVMNLGAQLLQLEKDGTGDQGARVLSDASNLIYSIVEVFDAVGLHPVLCVRRKVWINGMKYPMDTVGWNDASGGTDGRTIPKHKFSVDDSRLTNAESLDDCARSGGDPHDIGIAESAILELEGIVSSFSRERGWTYSETGLALSLRAEYGEVCGALEYVDLESALHEKVVGKLAMELADLLIYCIHCRIHCRMAGRQLSR